MPAPFYITAAKATFVLLQFLGGMADLPARSFLTTDLGNSIIPPLTKYACNNSKSAHAL